MKRTTALSLALALCAAPGVVAADEGARSELAVLRAENRSRNAWWDEVGAERAQRVLISRLADGGPGRVMARAELAEILAAERLWLSGELSPAGAIRVGRELGVRYLVVTTLVEFGTGARHPGKEPGKRSGRRLFGLGGPRNFRTEIVLRLMETGSGRTVWSDSRRAETALGEILTSHEEEGERVEATVFESTLLPLLEEMAGRLSAATAALLQETSLAPETGQAGREVGEQPRP